MSGTLDLQPVLQPLLQVAGLVITGLIAVYVPRAVSAFEKATGVRLSEQQRQTVLGAVQTAAGSIETRLDQGAMQVANVHVGDPAVLAQAQAAINAVPAAASALGITTQDVARMVVGAVDTASHGTVPPPVPAAVP